MPPDNSGFMVAAYVVGSVLIFAYAAYLFIRIRRHK